MQYCKAVFALIALVCIHSAGAQTRFGAQGAEGEPNRRQQWLLPSPDPGIVAHGVLYRPAGDGPFPLALIAHDSTQNAPRRAQMPQPEYRALAAWLVGRGYAVMVPERPGHGATGGPYLEDQGGGCDDANYSRAGYATADSIKAALSYLLGEKFIRNDGVAIIGNAAGGWGALALAGEDPKVISAIIAFAPGRGHADDTPNKVCAPRALIASAAEFADDAKIPVTWLVAANDSYFPPDLSKQMADSFRSGGGNVDFRVLAAFGSEGHALAEADGGDKIFGPALDAALKTGPVKSARKK